MTVDGDVASFDQEAYRERLAEVLGVNVTHISLAVQAASIHVTATVSLESESDKTAAAVQDAAVALTAGGAANASSALGLNVTLVEESVVESVIVLAPSPPP
eukprot:6412417-Prymnesium_polylepis.1